MNTNRITLKILLPYQIFVEKTDVKEVVADTVCGSYGFLPNRLDFVAGLEPGILMYKSDSEGKVFVALDEGVMTKTGKSISISVRNAIGGTDLGKLHEAVEKEFLTLGEQERDVRVALAKLESGFVRRFMEIQKSEDSSF